MKVGLTLLLISCAMQLSTGAQILTVIPTAGPSQFNLIMTLMNELANRGHRITVITATPGKTAHPNITVYAQDVPSFSEDMLKEFLKTSLSENPSGMRMMIDFFHFDPIVAEKFFTKKEVKDLIANGLQYDIAIVDLVSSEWATAITTLAAKNTMYISTCGPTSWANPAPIPPSYVPTFFEPMPSKMDFYHRLRNSLVYAMNNVVYHTVFLNQQQTLLNKFVPLDPPLYIREALKKIHFIVANEDPVMYTPRPSIPSVINAGCWHCKAAKTLPKDLEDFVQQSGEHGFIMFGLGTNVKSEFLPHDVVQNILKAFGRLKQNVIWKFGAKLENIPKNVKIIKWMPQQDMLGHPKLKLFMSHGGLLSMQEAIYHGKPVIGFPVFFDQHGNVARIKELGMGEGMSLLNITEEGVYQTVSKVLNDKSYSETAKKLSNILRDQPEHPMERAIFGVEYFIRHNGAFHLRSAAQDLNFFQYFLLDVISVLFLAGTVVCFVLMKTTKLIVRKLGFCACISSTNKNLKKTN